MLYFSLPDFYLNLKINNYFTNLAKKSPEKFKVPVIIASYHGNFPFNSWNGGYNNCYNNYKTLLYNDYIQYFNSTQKPIRLNCTNTLLTQTDYYDNLNRVILSIFENGCNFIEIADLKLLEFLENKNINYKYIFSHRAALFQEYTSDLINQINSFNKFDLIEIPNNKLNDIDFLSNLNHKEKIELIVNGQCPATCSCQTKCQQQEDLAQLSFSCKSPIGNCVRRFNFPVLPLEEIQDKYMKLGFTHYKIDFIRILTKPITALEFYTQYFIKPEYQFEVLSRGLDI